MVDRLLRSLIQTSNVIICLSWRSAVLAPIYIDHFLVIALAALAALAIGTFAADIGCALAALANKTFWYQSRLAH